LSQKVLTDFQAPLELFSLEEEAALLPGGLFVLPFVPLARKLAFNIIGANMSGTLSSFVRITC
jgi:hypothetical protein